MFSLRTALLLASALTTKAVFATDFTYTGPTPGTWDNSANWSPTGFPNSASDTARINATNSITTYTITSGSTMQVSALNPHYTITTGNNSIDLSGMTGLQFDNGAINITTNSLGSYGLIMPPTVINGSLQITESGSLVTVKFTSTISETPVGSGATLTILTPAVLFDAGNTYTGSTTVNSGLLALDGPDGAPYQIPGDLNILGNGQVISGLGGDVIAHTSNVTLNSGTFDLSAGDTGTTFGSLTFDAGTFVAPFDTNNTGVDQPVVLTSATPITMNPANTNVALAGLIQLNNTSGGTVTQLNTSGGGSSTFNDTAPGGAAATLTLGDGVHTSTWIFDIVSSGFAAFDMEIDSKIIDGGSSSSAASITKQNTGLLLLTSTGNTYFGQTSITAGTLKAGASSTLSPNSAHTISGGTLNLNGFAQTIPSLTFNSGTLTQGGATLILTKNTTALTMRGGNTISGPLKIQNGGAITFDNTNNGTATISGSVELNGTTPTFNIPTSTSGVSMSVSGAIVSNSVSGGGVTVSGTGGAPILQFSGANTYTGTTTISTGTLQAGAAGTFSSGSAHAIAGTLDLNNHNQTINTISGAGSIKLNGATLTTGAGGATSFSGTIVNGTTAGGGLTKQNAGTLTLSGANTYTGTTTITTGTLALSGSGSIANSSTVAATGTFDISAVTPASASIVDLNSSGSVHLGSKNLTLTNPSSTFSGSISGSGGSLTKQGAGTFTLTGNNSYSGATNVTAGTLAISSDSNVGTSNVLNLSGATLQANGGATLSTTNIAVTGTGTLDTNGNTFSIASNITGAGSINKISSGNLILSGLGNSIGGSTTVSAGRLSVNGNLVTPGGVTVASGATLGGNTGLTQAITGNVTIQTGGFLSPGNSIGTLTVNGNVVLQSGTTFNSEISPTNASLLKTTGTFTIGSNDTLNITVDPGIYPSSVTYTLIDSGGLLGAHFATVSLSLPTFAAHVEYTADDVILTNVTTMPISFVVSGGNAGAVATCLDSLSAPSGSDAELVIAELRQIPTTDELTQALELLQPSQFTALALAQENAMLYTSDTVFYRLHQITEFCPVSCKSKNPKECPKEKHHGYWLTSYGGYSFQKNQNEQPGFHTKTGGVTTGFDVAPSSLWIVGGALGYSYDHLKWKEGFGHANIQDGFGAFYLGCSGKHAYLFGTALGSYDHYHTARHIEIGGGVLTEIDRTAKGSHNGWHASGHLEAGLLFGTKAQFAPFVQANYIYIHENGFKEHGAESLDLHVLKKKSDLLEGEAGFQISRCFSSSTNKFSPFVGFSVIREWRFKGKHTKSSFAGSSCVMKTTGMNPERTLYSPVAGMTLLLPSENCTLSVEYKGKFGEHFQDNRILAEFLVKF